MNSRVKYEDWVENTFTYRPSRAGGEEPIGKCLGEANAAIHVGRIPVEELMRLPVTGFRPSQALVTDRLVLLAPVVDYHEGGALLFVRSADGLWRKYRFSPVEYAKSALWRSDLEQLDEGCSGSDAIWDIDPQQLTIVVENHACITRTLVFALSR